MIVLKEWLNEFIDLSAISTDEIVKRLNSIGLEVDGVKNLRMPKGVVVGYVKSTSKHPDADKLNVCEVDIGCEILQIVCGASNVAAGQYVPVATIGAVMPSGLEIKRAKLRGVESCGMICSASELGLPKLNEGILPLDESIGELVLGRELSEYAALNDDAIEIGLTPNRGDCQSIYGVARDLSAALEIALKQKPALKDGENLLGIGRVVSIQAEEGSKASFACKAFELQERLSESLLFRLRLELVGAKKSSCIERLCEYFSLETGVVLNAFSYEKLKDEQNRVSFKIKNGSFDESLIYCDKHLVLSPGISQPEYGKASDDDKSVIIGASYVRPEILLNAINKDKSIKKGDELMLASKGSEPELGLGLEALFAYILGQKGASIYAGTQQVGEPNESVVVSFSLNEIDALIGQKVDKNEIIHILKKLGFELSFTQDRNSLSAKVPAFRHDITNVQDICEEIVRIIGIDNIKPKPLIFAETNRLNQTYHSYKNALSLRQRAASVGFFESVHFVFDSAEDLQELGFKLCGVKVANPISNELGELRTTLINHLLRSCEFNIKNNKKSVKLFELGAIFDKDGNQSESLAFAASGLGLEPGVSSGAKGRALNFFDFAQMIAGVIGEFSLQNSSELKFLSPYEQAKIYQNGVCVGYMGRVNAKIEQARDLEASYVCEIDFTKLKFEKKLAKAYSKFPNSSRDLSLLVPVDMRYEKIKELITSLKISELKEFYVVDIYKDKSLNDKQSLSIKFIFQAADKTLEDSEVNQKIELILQSLKQELEIELR